jgi:hypothetical protein
MNSEEGTNPTQSLLETPKKEQESEEQTTSANQLEQPQIFGSEVGPSQALRAAGKEQTVDVDQELLDKLKEIGFDEQISTLALRRTLRGGDPSLDQIINWILDHNCEEGIDFGLPAYEENDMGGMT